MRRVAAIKPFLVRTPLPEVHAPKDVPSPAVLPEGARRVAQDIVEELPRARARGETDVVAYSLGKAALPRRFSKTVIEMVFGMAPQAQEVAAALAERGLEPELVARNQGGDTRLLISVPVRPRT